MVQAVVVVVQVLHLQYRLEGLEVLGLSSLMYPMALEWLVISQALAMS
jgi:hypothetical protein